MLTYARKPSAEPALLRAAVIGCGRIGCGFDDDPKRGFVGTHAGAFTRSARTALVALADVDAPRLDKYADKFHVAGRYADYRELLRRETPDVVSVCTRSDTHEPIVTAAAEAGVRAVFCEKPLADSLAAAERMIAVCRAHRTLLLVDHQRRFDAAHRAAADFVRCGRLGRLQQLTAYYTAGIANTGTHLLDLVRMFAGEIAWVQSRYSTQPGPDPADPNLDAWLGLVSGATVALQACDVSHYTIFELSLLGSAGRLRVMSHGFEFEYEEVAPHARFSGYFGLRPAPPPFATDPPREYLLQAVEHIADCLAGSAPPCSTGEDGRAALEAILALRNSAERGGARVALPLEGADMRIDSR